MSLVTDIVRDIVTDVSADIVGGTTLLAQLEAIAGAGNVGLLDCSGGTFAVDGSLITAAAAATGSGAFNAEGYAVAANDKINVTLANPSSYSEFMVFIRARYTNAVSADTGDHAIFHSESATAPWLYFLGGTGALTGETASCGQQIGGTSRRYGTTEFAASAGEDVIFVTNAKTLAMWKGTTSLAQDLASNTPTNFTPSFSSLSKTAWFWGGAAATTLFTGTLIRLAFVTTSLTSGQRESITSILTT